MANKLNRAIGPVAVANGDATIGTVPALHRWTVRHVRVVNNGATARTFKMGVGGVTDAKLIVQEITIQPKFSYIESMHVTLEDAETLQINASGTGMTITVNIIDQT